MIVDKYGFVFVSTYTVGMCINVYNNLGVPIHMYSCGCPGIVGRVSTVL